MVSLYHWDIGDDDNEDGVDAPGLRLLPRIKFEHINLTPRLRMRVNLAAQVLSESVGKALVVQGNYLTSETRLFISNFDQFFDCLNVSRLLQDVKSRKRARAPYTTADDWRFKWLKDDFLEKYINEWHRSSMAIVQIPKDERRRLCLSDQTLEGIRLTITSFCELGPLLLSLPGVKYFLSEKLSQDPLEEYFQKQRSRLGANENPTSYDFGRNFVALDVAGSSLVKNNRGNTRGAQRDGPAFDVADMRSLPRRKKKKKE